MRDGHLWPLAPGPPRKEDAVISPKRAPDGIAFNDLADLSDRSIQRILRETNTVDLAIALKGARKAVRDRILSNVSGRVATMIRDEMELSGPSRKDTEGARTGILETVQKVILAGRVPPPPWPNRAKKPSRRGRKPSKKDLAMKRTAQTALKRPLSELSFDEIDRMFVWFGTVARREGILELEGVTRAPDEFLSKGMQLLVDGTEPQLIRTILTNWMESLLQEQKVKYQKVVEGIASIQGGDNPAIIEQKLGVMY